MERTSKAQKRLVFLCWFIFAAAITGRYSFSANINVIIEHYAVSRAEAGLVNSCFFFAYGIGQIVHGLLCRFYNRRFALPVFMLFGGALTLVPFFSVPFALLKYLWTLNGFLHAALWPCLMEILGTSIDDAFRGKAVLTMGTTVASGTFAAYLSSFAFVHFLSFRISFLFGGAIMAAAGLAWLFGYRELGDKAELEAARHPREKSGAPKKRLSRKNRRVLIFICCFAVLSNFIKDGLQLWVPNVLKQFFSLPDSFSILLAMILPLLGVLGVTVSLWMQKHLQNFISSETVYFLFSAVALGGLLLFLKNSLFFALLCFGLISLFQAAINNTNTSLAPLFLNHEADPGLLAGVINACCYLGSTGSSYGLGALADGMGWMWVFRMLLIMTLVPVVIGAAILMKRYVHLKKM